MVVLCKLHRVFFCTHRADVFSGLLEEALDFVRQAIEVLDGAGAGNGLKAFSLKIHHSGSMRLEMKLMAVMPEPRPKPLS